MRATLPLMLVASLAVHGLLAGGCTLAVWLGGSAPVHVRAVPPPTTLTLISSDSLLPPDTYVPPVQPAGPLPAPAAMTEPPSLPAPPRRHKAASLAVRPGNVPPAAPEANPNAHLPTAPSEPVLAPVPAPKLDGSRGVVFILDISGSMYEPYAGSTRLSYAREELCRRVRALPDGTPFAVVLYALRAVPSGPLVAAGDATRAAAVRLLMRDMDCGGGTNLPAGFAAAAALHAGAIVLATDGDLNMPAYVLEQKTRELLGPPEHSPALTIAGIAPARRHARRPRPARPGRPAGRGLPGAAGRHGHRAGLANEGRGDAVML